MFTELDREHMIAIANGLIVTDAINVASAILAINPMGDPVARAHALRVYAEIHLDVSRAPPELQPQILKLLEQRLSMIEEAATPNKSR